MKKLRLWEVWYNNQEIDKLGLFNLSLVSSSGLLKTRSIQLELGIPMMKLGGLFHAPDLTSSWITPGPAFVELCGSSAGGSDRPPPLLLHPRVYRLPIVTGAWNGLPNCNKEGWWTCPKWQATEIIFPGGQPLLALWQPCMNHHTSPKQANCPHQPLANFWVV